MNIITFMIMFSYEKKSSYKTSILSESQIWCPSPELLQVKFIIFYLKEIISFTSKTSDIRDWGQSSAKTVRSHASKSVFL